MHPQPFTQPHSAPTQPALPTHKHPRKQKLNVHAVRFCLYTQESGEPVNLFALFEGLRVVE